jgi:hypothetical protein
MLPEHAHVTSRHEGVIVLLLLAMDKKVLDWQVCMGRRLLSALLLCSTGCTGPCSRCARGRMILAQAREELLDASHSFWASLAKERWSIVG